MQDYKKHQHGLEDHIAKMKQIKEEFVQIKDVRKAVRRLKGVIKNFRRLGYLGEGKSANNLELDLYDNIDSIFGEKLT